MSVRKYRILNGIIVLYFHAAFIKKYFADENMIKCDYYANVQCDNIELL